MHQSPLVESDCFALVQPFSLGDYAGGARILRSLCDNAPCKVVSICTGARLSIPKSCASETLLPSRPPLGRLEHTRFASIGGWVEAVVAPSFRKRLTGELQRICARAVHIVPHCSGDFAQIYTVARNLGLPVFVSIHDDFRYTATGQPLIRKHLNDLGRLWREANGRFVISSELGEEYSHRYGKRGYTIHTDGIKVCDRFSYLPPTDYLHLYFMGLFHNPYRPNLRALVEGLTALSSQPRGSRITLKLRCGALKLEGHEARAWISVLPFCAPDVLQHEMRDAHLLYLPLPFGKKAQDFYRFSLSTKMVTYLSAGVPILYHGPEDAAAARYLRRNDAAILIHSNDPAVIQRVINQAVAQPERLEQIRQNALVAVERDFDPAAIRHRFWDAVSRNLSGGTDLHGHGSRICPAFE